MYAAWHFVCVREFWTTWVFLGLVSLLLCSVPVALGMPWWLGLGLSLILLYTLLRWWGQRIETPPG